MTDHPIIPPPELVQQWRTEPEYASANQLLTMVSMTQNRLMELCQKSAQYGADQELEACCEYLVRCAQWEPEDVDELRAARRPKPMSLKEQALQALSEAVKMADDVPPEGICSSQADIIRRALEQIDD
jgi:hypothetical protein